MSGTAVATAIPSKTYDANAVQQILQDISTAGHRLKQNEPGSHEALLDQARTLVIALESPVESIYSLLIAEVIGIPSSMNLC